ncbi:hypothetical protein P20495_2728 [Pseudoalteromonas sp. BSi20495]|nr:hypothetical protein P20495_2728 [Pseudoalteromonas sp. BSi20495]
MHIELINSVFKLYYDVLNLPNTESLSLYSDLTLKRSLLVLENK